MRTQVVYENPWIRVREDQVLRPDRQPGIYGVVEVKSIATGVVPIDRDRSTYLVGQYRYPLDAYSWEIPEGGGAPDVDPQAAAARELREETGIVAESWDFLGQVHLSNSITDEVGFVYVARKADPRKAKILQAQDFAGLGIAENGAQRLVDLVRHHGGELAHDGEACRMSQLATGFLGPLLVGDVIADDLHFAHILGPRLERVTHPALPAAGAVRARHFALPTRLLR